MNRAGEKTAIIKSINAKLPSSTFRSKVNNINVLQAMALLQNLYKGTTSAALVKVKLNVTFRFLLPLPLDSSQGGPNPAVLSL